MAPNATPANLEERVDALLLGGDIASALQLARTQATGDGELPGRLAGYKQMARIATARGLDDVAVEALTKLGGLGFGEAWAMLGTWQSVHGNTTAATAAYERALSTSSARNFGLSEYCAHLEQVDDPHLTSKVLNDIMSRHALNEDPNPVVRREMGTAALQLAVAHLQLEQPLLAVVALRRAITFFGGTETVGRFCVQRMIERPYQWASSEDELARNNPLYSFFIDEVCPDAPQSRMSALTVFSGLGDLAECSRLLDEIVVDDLDDNDAQTYRQISRSTVLNQRREGLIEAAKAEGVAIALDGDELVTKMSEVIETLRETNRTIGVLGRAIELINASSFGQREAMNMLMQAELPEAVEDLLEAPGSESLLQRLDASVKLQVETETGGYTTLGHLVAHCLDESRGASAHPSDAWVRAAVMTAEFTTTQAATMRGLNRQAATIYKRIVPALLKGYGELAHADPDAASLQENREPVIDVVWNALTEIAATGDEVEHFKIVVLMCDINDAPPRLEPNSPELGAWWTRPMYELGTGALTRRLETAPIYGGPLLSIVSKALKAGMAPFEEIHTFIMRALDAREQFRAPDQRDVGAIASASEVHLGRLEQACSQAINEERLGFVTGIKEAAWVYGDYLARHGDLSRAAARYDQAMAMHAELGAGDNPTNSYPAGLIDGRRQVALIRGDDRALSWDLDAVTTEGATGLAAHRMLSTAALQLNYPTIVWFFETATATPDSLTTDVNPALQQIAEELFDMSNEGDMEMPRLPPCVWERIDAACGSEIAPREAALRDATRDVGADVAVATHVEPQTTQSPRTIGL